MNVDDFGVRWTGTFRPPQTGTYRLALIGTIKFELYLDDSLVTRSFYPTHDGEYPGSAARIRRSRCSSRAATTTRFA